METAQKHINLYLPDFIEDDLASTLLDGSINSLFNKSLDIVKSMYDFDVNTDDGINRLLSLLPVLDPEVIKIIIQDVWAGYPVESEKFDTSLARAELRGYLLGLTNSDLLEEVNA